MAVFAFSEPQRFWNRRISIKALARRILDASIEARMAQAQKIVEDQVTISVSDAKRADQKLDAMVVGKNGVNVWPY